MFGLSPVELMIVGIVAVLLFGSKLPSVAHSMGKSMTEFKNGMRGVENEFRSATRIPTPAPRFHAVDDREEPTAPRFEPPTPPAIAAGEDEPSAELASSQDGTQTSTAVMDRAGSQPTA